MWNRNKSAACTEDRSTRSGVVGSCVHARNTGTLSRHRQLPPRNSEGTRKEDSPLFSKLWLQTFRESIRNMKIRKQTHATILATSLLTPCSSYLWLSWKMKYFFPLHFTYAEQNPWIFLEFLLRIPDIPAMIFRHQALADREQINTMFGTTNIWGFLPLLSSTFSSNETVPSLVLIY